MRTDNTGIGQIIQNNANTVAYQTTSDIRLKTNIQSIQYGLPDLMKIEVKSFVYKDEPNDTQVGFIAQQLYEVYPDVVHVGGEDAKTDPWMVEYGKLTPLLVKSTQDQQKEIEDQLQQIEAQQQRIADLEEALQLAKDRSATFEQRLKAIELVLDMQEGANEGSEAGK